jgi:hypothetical protein
LEDAFHQLLFEGTGDIDLRRTIGGQSILTHLQVKDHEVTAGEFKKAVAQFRDLDMNLGGAYACFTLVCPSLAQKLQPVEFGLARYRKAKPFYEKHAAVLAPTKDELDARIRKLGFDADTVEFIRDKVYFEIGYAELRHDDRAIDLFIGRLLKHPEYADRLRAAVQPAFAELLRAIQGKRGSTIDRADLAQLVRAAVANGIAPEKGVTIWLQNWTKEKFDPPADYEVDWSPHFDRASRRVPSEAVWNGDLLKDLQELKARVMAERTERLIRFRGKCALSTGIALGATFPAVGGWSFEIPQPPAKELWRSDSVPTAPYDFAVHIADGGGSGSDLVLGLNIRGDGRRDIQTYIGATSPAPRLIAFMGPAAPGSQAIGGSADACAFARAVRERIGQIVKDHGITHMKLFFYGPQALAVFLGQQLTAVGEIQLFEYQDPGYVPSFRLRT